MEARTIFKVIRVRPEVLIGRETAPACGYGDVEKVLWLMVYMNATATGCRAGHASCFSYDAHLGEVKVNS